MEDSSDEQEDLEESWNIIHPVRVTLRQIAHEFQGQVWHLSDGKVVVTYREVWGRIVSRKYRHLKHATNEARNFVLRSIHKR